METITYDKQGYVATIHFNRPEKMNAITPDMMVQLYECVEEINANMDIRAVVVTGGDKVFCAGSDIKKLVTYDTPWDFHNRQKDYPTSIRLIRKPTIAMINGYCLGGGLEMAISADMRYASENANSAHRRSIMDGQEEAEEVRSFRVWWDRDWQRKC